MTPTFDYRVRWPSGQIRQGEHSSASAGDGGGYRGDRLLREVRDARQLSLRACLRDPFERLWVREYLHSATLDLWILVDASGSMRAGGDSSTSSGVTVAGRLVRSAALSARGVGDRVGVYCAAESPLAQCCSPPSRQAVQSLAIGEQIESLATTAAPGALATSAKGLMGASAALGAQRSLVFLVSDFHPDRCDWDLLLQALAHHDVVPVVVWNLPGALVADRSGLMSLRDAETGRYQMVWMRRALRHQILARLNEHFAACERLCRRHARRAIHLYDGFDALALTRYFYGAQPPQTPGMRLSRPS